MIEARRGDRHCTAQHRSEQYAAQNSNSSLTSVTDSQSVQLPSLGTNTVLWQFDHELHGGSTRRHQHVAPHGGHRQLGVPENFTIHRGDVTLVQSTACARNYRLHSPAVLSSHRKRVYPVGVYGKQGEYGPLSDNTNAGLLTLFVRHRKSWHKCIHPTDQQRMALDRL